MKGTGCEYFIEAPPPDCCIIFHNKSVSPPPAKGIPEHQLNHLGPHNRSASQLFATFLWVLYSCFQSLICYVLSHVSQSCCRFCYDNVSSQAAEQFNITQTVGDFKDCDSSQSKQQPNILNSHATVWSQDLRCCSFNFSLLSTVFIACVTKVKHFLK